MKGKLIAAAVIGGMFSTLSYAVFDMADKARSTRRVLEQKDFQIISLKEEARMLREGQLALRKRLAATTSSPGIAHSHVRNVIRSTLEFLGLRREDWERLLMLTVCTESDMGRYLHQVKGPAKGIWQVEPETERTVLNWLEKREKGMYEKVKRLRVPARLDIHEMEYNLAYAVAVAVNVYRMRKVNPHPKSGVEDLANIYKKHYNTYKGKATVKGVLEKLEAYNVRL